jgi:hypothetical protein
MPSILNADTDCDTDSGNRSLSFQIVAVADDDKRDNQRGQTGNK